MPTLIQGLTGYHLYFLHTEFDSEFTGSSSVNTMSCCYNPSTVNDWTTAHKTSIFVQSNLPWPWVSIGCFTSNNTRLSIFWFATWSIGWSIGDRTVGYWSLCGALGRCAASTSDLAVFFNVTVIFAKVSPSWTHRRFVSTICMIKVRVCITQVNCQIRHLA